MIQIQMSLKQQFFIKLEIVRHADINFAWTKLKTP